MRFLPEQKNKRVWSVGLLLVSVAGIIYFNFFAQPGRPNLRPPGQAYPAADPAGSGAAAGSAAALAKPVARKSQGGLLPYGTTIETAIVEQSKFKILKAGPELKVAEDELGKDDLFAK